MDECELIVLISTVACAISKSCSDDEITILSAVFTQLGDTLATILAKRELCDRNTQNDEKMDSNNDINERC